MEKTISIRNTEITFSIWDLGGQREFVNMLPLVCNDAVAILFMFDLTRKSTLNSIKEWYRQGRGFNKTAIPFLVGTKYDHFVNFPREEQEEISTQAKRFAKAMKASLIFSSTSHSINVQKVGLFFSFLFLLLCSLVGRGTCSRGGIGVPALTFLTLCRSSRSSCPRLSTFAAPFPRSKTSASLCCSTLPSESEDHTNAGRPIPDPQSESLAVEKYLTPSAHPSSVDWQLTPQRRESGGWLC